MMKIKPNYVGGHNSLSTTIYTFAQFYYLVKRKLLKNLIRYSFLIVILSLLDSVNLFSQNALPNPGFEDWTTTGTYEDPDGWTTANSYSTLVGVQLTTKANTPADVHSGNFALKTETVFIPQANQPVPGLVTTGTLQITTQTIDGGTPYTSRPDSIGGWYKYAPTGDDSAYITFFLFSFFRDTIGRAIFAGGTTNGVYRWFSAPVEYEMPDNPYTAFFVITPSPRYGAEAGSVLWLDDMEIIFATGIKDNEAGNSINIYPSVVKDKLIIDNPVEGRLLLTITDETGRLVLNTYLNIDRNEIHVDLPSGAYIASISKKGEIIKNQKLIICQ